MIDKQASIQPVAHVAKTCGVSHHVVQHGFEAGATQEIERTGLAVKEDQPLHPPRFLGSDECATRKGHRSDTIVCDLDTRQVGEVRAGRKLEDVTAVLERLCDPDAVKAVSMDRSASFRPAVQLCLPKAHIVVDHLPVIQPVMKGLKNVLSSWAHQKEGKPLLKGKQQLFLKAKEDVTEEQAKERTPLGELLPWLETAWQRKRRVTSLVCHHDRSHCGHGTAIAGSSRFAQLGPALMRKTLSAFKHWRQAILAFFQFLPARLSTGCVEGKHHCDLCLDAPGFWVAPSPAPSSAHCSWRGRLTFFLISLHRVERQKMSGLLAHQRSFERKGKAEAHGLIS